jgi:hypothetical protein
MPFVLVNAYHSEVKIESLSKLDGLLGLQANKLRKSRLCLCPQSPEFVRSFFCHKCMMPVETWLGGAVEAGVDAGQVEGGRVEV